MKVFENHAQDTRYREMTYRLTTVTARFGTGGWNVPLVSCGEGVRSLTPLECERLQGFPDNWTRIPYKGKSAENCPDSPRYKAIGNSWAVPCVQWLGRMIDAEFERLGVER